MSRLCHLISSALAVLVVAVLPIHPISSASAQAPQPDSQELPQPSEFAPTSAFQPGAFVPGRVVVRWQTSTTLAGVSKSLESRNLQVAQTLEGLNAAILQVPPGAELATIDLLKADPLVAGAEPDYLAYADSPAVATPGVQPDDTYWRQQWAPRRMQAPLAWELSTGQASVLVAIIDTGIDLGHPEFAGRIVPGYDYVSRDPVPQDDNGHGTHIAGLVATAGNNNRGVAGIAWNARLLIYKALNSQGVGSAATIAEAVQAATSRGASIIDLSLSLSGPSSVLQSAIQSAYAAGAVIVASSGNQSGAVTYPAAYPDVIAVGATTHWEDWAGYSNYGPEVDVAAPGGVASDQILSTGLSGGYASLYGTSMAAPYVAGVAALIRSVAPQMSNATIAGILRNTADKVGAFPYTSGRNNYLGYGRVNAAKAIRQALTPQLTFAPLQVSMLAQADGALPDAEITLGNPSSQPLTWQLVEIDQDWLDVDPPWTGTLAYPSTALLHMRVNSPMPLGVHTATIRLRPTSLSGQQVDYLLSVRLTVASRLYYAYAPVIQSNYTAPGWIDTSSGSVGVILGDDGVQSVGLPFSFPFYDKSYSQVWIHANGFLSFGQSYGGSQFANNQCIPSLQPPDGAIYALWDDLDPSRSGRVSYMTASDGAFVVEWREVPRRGAATPNTFQVVLRNDGAVTLQYQAVADPGSATVGLENWDNTMGWQVACNGSGDLPVAGQAWQLETALP